MIFHDLTEALAQPEQVSSLILRNKDLTSIASIPWQKFTSLTQIDLSNNDLKTLPRKLLRCQNLRQITLNNNRFTSLPVWFNECKTLKKLFIAGNRIRKIDLLPKQLEALDLSQNKLKEIPVAVSACKQLLYLNINGNNLRDLDLFGLGELRVLHASNCRLKSIDSLPEYLMILDVSANKLRNIPSNWSNLKEITDVNFSQNPIVLSQENFKQNTTLVFLNLSQTKSKIDFNQLLKNNVSIRKFTADFTVKQQESIDRFLAIHAHFKTPWPVNQLWQLWQGKCPRLIAEKDLEKIWKTETLSIAVRLSACFFWQKKGYKKPKALAKKVWQISERKDFSFSFWEQLDKSNIGYKKVVVEENERLLFLSKSANELLDSRTLIRYLDRKNGRKFTFSKDQQLIFSMRRMIGEKNEINQAWLDYLAVSGVPDLVLPELCKEYIYGKKEKRAPIRQVISPYLPLPIQLLFEAFVHEPHKQIHFPKLSISSLTGRILQQLKRA